MNILRHKPLSDRSLMMLGFECKQSDLQFGLYTKIIEPGVVVFTCNPNTQEAEVGGSLVGQHSELPPPMAPPK
jgi:hypothetical protein